MLGLLPPVTAESLGPGLRKKPQPPSPTAAAPAVIPPRTNNARRLITPQLQGRRGYPRDIPARRSLCGTNCPLAFLADQPPQRLAVGRQQLLDAWVVYVGDDDLADLLVHIAEDAVRLHLFGLVEVVLGRRDIVDRVGLEPMHQPQVDQRHQALLPQSLFERVLVTHREDGAFAAILERREDHVGQFLVALTEDAELEQLRTGAVRSQLDTELFAKLVVLAPHRQPVLE